MQSPIKVVGQRPVEPLGILDLRRMAEVLERHEPAALNAGTGLAAKLRIVADLSRNRGVFLSDQQHCRDRDARQLVDDRLRARIAQRARTAAAPMCRCEVTSALCCNERVTRAGIRVSIASRGAMTFPRKLRT
jgi:hypothetical protein